MAYCSGGLPSPPFYIRSPGGLSAGDFIRSGSSRGNRVGIGVVIRGVGC